MKLFQTKSHESFSDLEKTYNYNPQEILLNHYKDKISFKSPQVSENDVASLKNAIKYPKEALENESKVIKQLNIDPNLFATAWGNDPIFYQPFNKKLCQADKEAIDRLRLVYFYSGWPIVTYHHPETFPVIDPTLTRYLKSLEVTPKNLQYQAPNICGEAGWKVNGGIVNHDVAIAQERLQFLHFSGALEQLNKNTKPICVEIGAGIGMFAMAFIQSFSSIDYYIIDIPSVLIQSFSYLSVTKPDWQHDFMTPEGIVNTNNKTSSHRIIYIPFYLLPKILQEIKPHLILNLMSLHEMKDEQISYYCEIIAQMLQHHQGIFMEFNSFRGHSNPRTFDVLNKYFNHHRRYDFPNLGMVPTLWTNSINKIEAAFNFYKKQAKNLDFEKIFSFVDETEYPVIKDPQIQKLLDKDLGAFINCSLTKFMTKNNLIHANHLRHYRYTLKLNQKPVENDERFWTKS